MLYFADAVGKKVFSQMGPYVGKLTDMLFLADEQPIITKFVVTTPQKTRLYIPVDSLKKINHKVDLAPDFQSKDRAENELSLRTSLMDHQIIDINGNKIVRVNDVAIQDKPNLIIAGVDIGLLGVLRWLGIENVVNKWVSLFGFNLTSRFLSWADIQPIELTSGKIVMKKDRDKLERIRPEDLADHLEKMNIANIKRILTMVEEEFAAEVIENLNLSYQQPLFRQLPHQKAAKILEIIEPDEAVDILLSLSERRRGEILKYIAPDKQAKIQQLLKFSSSAIGALMTSEFFSVAPDETAGKILSRIKSLTADFSYLRYVYVINGQNQLVGVFNLHELLLQTPDTPAYRFMSQNLIVAHLGTPEEIAIKKMLKYKLIALPVLDNKKAVIGVLTWDDMTESILKQME